ncbi:thioesterase family protein [Lyngbya aestuarii]|uniref:thioesterase family protein n=1 Tax=Lyngbya aestuarii TaxID=118322 RepID=UPI00403D889C
MPFTYNRTVRLVDTDAAGVVYFANVLVMCHEAYEESLAACHINLKTFVSNSATAFPIVHAAVDFLQPMFCGDQVLIQLESKQISNTAFEINYQIFAAALREQRLAQAITRHVCINPISRTRTPLPEVINQWLDCG